MLCNNKIYPYEIHSVEHIHFRESFTGRHPGPARHLTAHVSKCVAGRREIEREVEWCVHHGARQNWRCNSNEEPADVSGLHCHLSPW